MRFVTRTFFCAAFAWFLMAHLMPVQAQGSLPEVLAASKYPATLAVQRNAKGSVRDKEFVEQRVTDGERALPGQFPWQVAIVRGVAGDNDPFAGFFCGGTLIEWNWVLTAAHCTYEADPAGNHLPPIAILARDVFVYVGSHDFSGGKKLAVDRVVRHKYQFDSKDNDIALLRLSVPVTPSDKVAKVGLSVPAGQYATVVGWGATEKGILPPEDRKSVKELRFAKVQFKDSAACNKSLNIQLRDRAKQVLQKEGWSSPQIAAALVKHYPLSAQRINSNMVCAGGDGGGRYSDACFGDSGGPLVIKSGNGYKQVGLVSWGPDDGCGLSKTYGVYTNVIRYLPWIQQEIQR